MPLYPEVTAYDTGMLAVSDTHTVYYEQYGSPELPAVIALHGGPGGGSSPKMARFFNPLKWRVVLIDQRGSGKSTPHACLENNTTWDLVSDIEKLRAHVGIEKWAVFGGSWGSTLSLAYAQTHPERVTHLCLRGIFLIRKQELDWFYEEGTGASFIFPDAWEAYVAPVAPEKRGNMIAAYGEMLTSDDVAVRTAAAKAWSTWEAATSFLIQNQDYLARASGDAWAVAFARIENHYFRHGAWFDDKTHLLRKENIDKIRHIPTFTAQGRYDMVCPMRSAWDLHRAFPEMELTVLDKSGHSAFEEQITDALVDAMDKFASA
jgi:proline iminopeptidase